jgi:hypothetical protein
LAVAQRLVDGGATRQYDYALRTVSEINYDKWRDYEAEDTVRFYALRLRDTGLIKSTPREYRLALSERAQARAESVSTKRDRAKMNYQLSEG